MSEADYTYWENWYKQNPVHVLPPPNPLLFEFVPPLFEARPYRALDMACGVGQNAIWMTNQGYSVDAVDISPSAIAAGIHFQQQRFTPRPIHFRAADVEVAHLPHNTYDVVVVINFVRPSLVTTLRACVRPGGRIVYEAYNTDYLKREPQYNPEALFRIGELSGYFADWETIHKENVHGISRVVAIKPLKEDAL